jgi:hypothetical protein
VKIVFFLAFFLPSLFGDIFVVSGEQKVKMTPLVTGVVDYSTFDTIAKIKRSDRGIYALAIEKDFQPRHANFRIVTLDFPQSNMTIINWNKKISDTTYEIEFDNFTTDDGVMFQLFHHNKWYAAILGEPLEVLENLFSQNDLDPIKAYEAIQQARIAFSRSAKLKELEKVWHARATQTIDPDAKYKKQEKIDFKKIPKER